MPTFDSKIKTAPAKNHTSFGNCQILSNLCHFVCIWQRLKEDKSVNSERSLGFEKVICVCAQLTINPIVWQFRNSVWVCLTVIQTTYGYTTIYRIPRSSRNNGLLFWRICAEKGQWESSVSEDMAIVLWDALVLVDFDCLQKIKALIRES